MTLTVRSGTRSTRASSPLRSAVHLTQSDEARMSGASRLQAFTTTLVGSPTVSPLPAASPERDVRGGGLLSVPLSVGFRRRAKRSRSFLLAGVVRGDDLDCLRGVVRDRNELEILWGDETTIAELVEPRQQRLPMLRRDQADREVSDLPRLDEHQRLEELVERAEPTGEEPERLCRLTSITLRA